METEYPSFHLKTEATTASRPKLHQVDLFPQWYEHFITQETAEEVPLPPQKTPQPIKAWWNRNRGDDV